MALAEHLVLGWIALSIVVALVLGRMLALGTRTVPVVRRPTVPDRYANRSAEKLPDQRTSSAAG